ncbi:MAG: PD40 domain-containing protein [Acidobacteria bacterium]|nr:PD40 domain-containing protein [Acidobacteriota bacterium]
MTSPAGTASGASAPLPERYTFAPFALDISARKLWRESEEITLPSRAFDALAYLVRHADRPVEKDELIKAVWAGAFVSDDSIVHCVSVIRRALQDDVEHPRFVATLPRRGYQFVWRPTESAATISELNPTVDVEHALHGRGPAPVSTLGERKRAWMWPGLAGVALLIPLALVVARGGLIGEPQETPQGPVFLAQLPPPGTTLASGGILSPDGRHLAFVAVDQTSGTSRLWVRSLDSANVRAVAGTEGASKPFWSPDSQSIGYFAGDKLKTVALVGESARTIAAVSVSPTGGSWGSRGVIVFGDLGRGLYVVDATGGPVAALTTVDAAHDSGHAWPSFLPDGRRYLYTIASWNPDRAGIWMGSLDRREETRRVASAPSASVYAPQGYLLYVQDNTLVATRFDPERREVMGEPVPLVRNVLPPRLTDGDAFSMSGTLLSFRGGTRAEQLAWFTRAGLKIGTVDGPTALYNPMVSPDGTQLLATGSPARDPGLWLVDLRANASTRLGAEGIGPLWSPDGQRIAFTSRGGLDIDMSSTVGRAENRLLLRDHERKVVQDWSPDGRYIVYSRLNDETRLDLWLLTVADPHRSVPLLRTAANERGARISPDGRWMAYTSDESGQWEVYVQEFPELGSKRAASIGGGAGAFWRQDGRELFYLAPDRTLMAVDVRLDRTISIGRPRPLFRAPVSGDITEARNHYVAAPDGQRFLVNTVQESADRAAITVVVNWAGRLSRADHGLIDRAKGLLASASLR